MTFLDPEAQLGNSDEMLGKYSTLALTLVFMTLAMTLTSACYFRGFVCDSFGSGCRRCIVTSGPRCVCATASSYYGGSYDPYMTGGLYPTGIATAGAGAAGGPAGNIHHPYMDPEKVMRKRFEYMHPLSDRNIEKQTELLTHMARLHRMLS